MNYKDPALAATRRILTFMVKWPWLTLVVALLLTAGFGYLGSRLSITTDLDDLFPENTPHVVRAFEARQKLLSASQILIVVTSPEKQANMKFITELHDKIAGDPDIQSTELKYDKSFFKKNALLFLDQEELKRIDGKLKKAIKRAVSKELGPFDDEDGGEDDPEEGDDFDDDPFADLDEDFAEEEEEDEKEAVEETAKAAEDEDDGGSFKLVDDEELRKKYKAASLNEYFTNEQGTVYALKAYPSFGPGDVEKSKQLIQRIHKYAAALAPEKLNPEMEWALEGDYHKKIEEISVINSDLTKASVFALSVILVLALLYFGSIRALLFVFVPLLSGIAWTMGMAWLTVGYLNLITAFIFALMFGLGIDFAVHAASRYFEQRRAGLPVEEAVVEGLLNLGRPMIAAAITTTVTFLSLVVFDFRGFSQFGLIAGLGVPLCLLVIYMLLPPLAVIANRLWKEGPIRGRFSSKVGSALFGTRGRAALVTAAVLGCAIYLAPGLLSVGFEHDMSKVMTKKKESRRNRIVRKFRKQVESRSASPVVLLTGSIDETRKVHDFLKENGERYPRLEDVSSIYSFVPDDQVEKLALVRGMKERLDRKMGTLKGEDLEAAQRAQEFLEPSEFGVDDLPDWVKKKFTDKDGDLGHFVMLFARGGKADAHTVGEIIGQLDEIKVDGKSYYTTASYYILHDAYEIIRKEGPLAVALAGLAVLLLLILDFRRLSDVLAAFLPLALGVVCLLGFMGKLNMNLNMFNMVVLPTVLGIGVDTSIHLLHRVREEGPDRVGVVANTTGSAAGMSAATTAVGFGSFALATNPGLGTIGRLAPIGIMMCYLASVLLTCSFAYLWSKRRKGTKENGQEGG